MDIKLYDTLSGKKKLLKPRSRNKIEIFVCGPTVYNYSHIGHARTYIAYDALVKYLRRQGYKVRYVQNITDIEDKIIEQARKTGQKPTDIARIFETEYYHDMEKLGVDSVDKYARATDYIPQIISQIKRLIDKGYAYEIQNDGIYYDISTFKDYGKLSRRTAEQAEDAVSRIDESINKRNRGDFALWKISDPPAGGGEPAWQSPWGNGRPGWHIEDTAITETEFGAQYDIHGGARDLIFPHHESEIAQMEALSGKEPLVNYWVHAGFLTVGGEKMAKSLGNFITIHEFLRKHSKETLRMLVMSSLYRSPIDYSEKAVEQAEANVKRLEEFYNRLAKSAAKTKTAKAGPGPASKLDLVQLLARKKRFYKELEDDFSTPKAFAALFELVREGNSLIAKNKLSNKELGEILQFLDEVNNIFGIISKETAQIPKNIAELAKQREESRRNKEWKKSDEIRKEIENLGFTVKDTPSGPEIKKL